MRNLFHRIRNRLTYIGVGMTIAGLGVNLLIEYGPTAGIITPLWEKVYAYTGIGFIVIGVIIAAVGILKTPMIETISDDSLILLGLLDDIYQRLKTITRMTIRKMRGKKWGDVTDASPVFMSQT